MKLVRYGPAGDEKPGMLDGFGAIRDLSGVVEDIAGDVLLPLFQSSQMQIRKTGWK